MADTVKSLLSESSQDLADGDYETAIRNASTAIQLDPHNASAYEIRGSIYIEEKLWDRAERDYASAYKINPDVVYEYKLAEIKFQQKSYFDARPRFVALEGDPQLGDLARYKVFLCDLMSFHEAANQSELAELDHSSEKKPSYYFCHATWDLYHNQSAEAAPYLTAVQHLFDSSTTDLYLSSLLETRHFHLPEVTFVTKDGNRYDSVASYLDADGVHVAIQKGWATIPFNQLPDDLSGFPEELREQIQRKLAQLPDGPTPSSLICFTTRSGRFYGHVRWAVEDTGLSVLTSDGWIAIPFHELPDDLSTFPVALRDQIQQKRLSPLATPDLTQSLTFTSREGTTYAQVKAFPVEDGLRILTPEGWITLAYGDLPTDISSFPTGWQRQIQERRAITPNDPSGLKVISFTTKKGIHYDQVRSSISKSGLRLITPNGWIEVPYKELPMDVSVFPQVWRQTIASNELPSANNALPAHQNP